MKLWPAPFLRLFSRYQRHAQAGIVLPAEVDDMFALIEGGDGRKFGKFGTDEQIGAGDEEFQCFTCFPADTVRGEFDFYGNDFSGTQFFLFGKKVYGAQRGAVFFHPAPAVTHAGGRSDRGGCVR